MRLKGEKMKTQLLAVAFSLTFSVVHAQYHQIPELKSLNWQMSPSIGKVGDKGEFKISEPLMFLDSADTNKFLQFNGNLPNANSYTIAPKKGEWFGVLRFMNEGYVKDDEKIDPESLLQSLKEGNKLGNEEKRKQGLETMTLEGWYFPPRYDADTKRLEWGTKLRSDKDQSITVNVTTKILGRTGYISAILVSSPESLDKDLLSFKQALKGYDFVSGEKYSEWKEGDRVAAYGLGALVLGGAAAAATKKGGLKLIWLAILGAGAAIWAGLKSFFNRKK
jgi:uncharacterized membrane-anchored protein